MPKANAVAAELRKMAEALDKAPEALLEHVYLSLTAGGKEDFLSLAKAWPRPFEKKIVHEGKSYAEFTINHSPERSVYGILSVPQAFMCSLITPAQPAVYDCPSIFSEQELQEVSGD